MGHFILPFYLSNKTEILHCHPHRTKMCEDKFSPRSGDEGDVTRGTKSLSRDGR